MSKQSDHEAAIPNAALKAFSGLIGEWTTVGKHRLMPDMTLHGHASFEWLEGGAFLVMRSEVEEPGVPSGISIIGSDDAKQTYSMLYFDERNVSRLFEVSVQNNVFNFWRDMPGFSQRFTWTLSDDGDTIIALSELNEDNVNWKRDLETTYTRVR